MTISGKSVLIRDNKLVRTIRSAPIRVIAKAEIPLRHTPWFFAGTNIRSAPHREFLKKKKSAPGSDFNPYISLLKITAQLYYYNTMEGLVSSRGGDGATPSPAFGLIQRGGDVSVPSPVFGFICTGDGSLLSPVFGFI